MLQRLIKRSKSNKVAKERLQRIMPSGHAQPEETSVSRLQIEVNLLPPEHAPESPYNLRNVSFLILSFLILIFLALNTMRMTTQEKVFDQQNQSMLQVLNNYRQLKGQIDALKERTALLRQRRDLFADAIDHRKTWADKLNAIRAQIPGEMWLSEVYIKREKPKTSLPTPPKDKPKNASPSQSKLEDFQPEEPQEQIKLYILGDTKDLSTIAELINRLEAIPFLQQTQLNRVNQREENNRLVMFFEIVTQLRPEES